MIKRPISGALLSEKNLQVMKLISRSVMYEGADFELLTFLFPLTNLESSNATINKMLHLSHSQKWRLHEAH